MSNSKLATAAFVLAMGAFASIAHAGGDVINYGASMPRHGGGAAIPVPAPIPVPDTQSGYYVRLDAAYSQNSISKYQATDPRADAVRGDSYLDNFGRYGGGIGYQFNRWFRMDATYDIRSNVTSRGSGTIDYTVANPTGIDPTIRMRDTISDSFTTSNATGLINAYLDAPVSHSFTPYVGLGIGFARHQLSGRSYSRTTTCVDDFDCDPVTGGDQLSATVLNSTASARAGQNNITLATAAMAGFSYKVWDNTKLDLGYRYLHLQGYTVTGISTGAPENLKVPNQNIHELRAGVRFDIN